jgi:ATP-binding cassette, subfamily B (MDR/TAP), member 6
MRMYNYDAYIQHILELHFFAGELIRVIDRGTSSMRVLLESMLFSIGPALIDVIVAATYLSSKQAWMAVIVLLSVGLYVPVTVVITEYRGVLRRFASLILIMLGTSHRNLH